MSTVTMRDGQGWPIAGNRRASPTPVFRDRAQTSRSCTRSVTRAAPAAAAARGPRTSTKTRSEVRGRRREKARGARRATGRRPPRGFHPFAAVGAVAVIAARPRSPADYRQRDPQEDGEPRAALRNSPTRLCARQGRGRLRLADLPRPAPRDAIAMLEALDLRVKGTRPEPRARRARPFRRGGLEVVSGTSASGCRSSSPTSVNAYDVLVKRLDRLLARHPHRADRPVSAVVADVRGGDRGRDRRGTCRSTRSPDSGGGPVSRDPARHHRAPPWCVGEGRTRRSTPRSTRSSWRPTPNKIEIRKAIEAIFNVPCPPRVNTINRKGKAQAQPAHRHLVDAIRPAPRHRVARRAPATTSKSSGADDARTQNAKPTSPGRRFPERLRLRRHHDRQAREVAHPFEAQHRWPQTRTAARRRVTAVGGAQAAVPDHRLSSARRTASPAKVASIEYDPQTATGRASRSLHYRDGEKALHHRPGRSQGSATCLQSGSRIRDPGR